MKISEFIPTLLFLLSADLSWKPKRKKKIKKRNEHKSIFDHYINDLHDTILNKFALRVFQDSVTFPYNTDVVDIRNQSLWRRCTVSPTAAPTVCKSRCSGEHKLPCRQKGGMSSLIHGWLMLTEPNTFKIPRTVWKGVLEKEVPPTFGL